jgi:hypothetical protein
MPSNSVFPATPVLAKSSLHESRGLVGSAAVRSVFGLSATETVDSLTAVRGLTVNVILERPTGRLPGLRATSEMFARCGGKKRVAIQPR